MAQDPSGWARVGAAAQGLPALECLLFPVAGIAAPTVVPVRCEYLARIAKAVADEASALAKDWERWREAAGSMKADAASLLLADAVNGLVGVLDQLRGKRLAKPASSRSREPAFDAWRSQRTGTMLRAPVDGVRVVVTGESADTGLTGVLRGRGHLLLAGRLERELQTVERTVAALPDSMTARKAAPQIQIAVGALARMQRLVGGSVAEAFKVRIGFNETDGD